jgi:hypothetical protein
MKLAAAVIIAPSLMTILICAPSASAREPARSLEPTKTTQPPVIDGKLDDECWSKATVTTDFIEYKTERSAREQTLVRVLYDDQNLYVAFECMEPEPEKIIAAERKYDQSLYEEDRVEVQIDTLHDHRGAYIFTVNTLGTRYDARQGLFGKEDDTWGCEWSVACLVTDDRWFAEFAIPIGNLFFQKKDNTSWGINFRRTEKGLQESSYWCFRNSQARYPQEFGNLTNLNLANAQVNSSPEFEVYVSNTTDTKHDSTKVTTGVDTSVRFNSEFVGAFTINPDFGQVEADPDTIELRDTERFLKERRPFFREGSELFNTPLNIYYSRRFMDIDAGAKITGQGQDWALGLIDVQGKINRDDHLIDGNYHIGRFIQNIGQASHFGLIWANSAREDGRNFTGGFDTRFFLDSTTYFTTQWLGLSDSEGIETDDGDTKETATAFYTALDGGSSPFWWHVNYTNISKGFVPDLGYIPRRNIRGPTSYLRYKENLEQGPFKWISAMLWTEFYEDNDHNTSLRDFSESVGACLRNEVELWYTHADKFHEPYQNRYDRVRVEYNEEVDIWDSISAGFEKGVYEKEPYHEYFVEKPLRITDRLFTTLQGNYRITDQLQGGDEDIWLWRWVTQYNFLWNGRFKLTVEQTSEDRHNFTALFSWPIKNNIDFYLLFNDYEVDGDDVQVVFAKYVYRF